MAGGPQHDDTARPVEDHQTPAERGAVPPLPPGKVPRVNRVLGPTAGPWDGNARALLGALLALAFVVLLAYLSWEYLHNDVTAARDMVVGGWSALLTAFGLVVGLYFGRRDAEATRR